MLNAITVDVEEYFHAANIERVVPPRIWHAQPSRVEASTDRLLEVFATHSCRGTFFVLGCVARRHPALVRRIADAGHEIASHGYGHRLVTAQTRKAFARDIRKSKFLLEQVVGREVVGYRAPNFSIRDSVLWAYEELVAAGYRYDSSLHPVAHPRYGNTHRATEAALQQTPAGPLILIPLTVLRLQLGNREFRLPVAGGAYWRLFPRLWTLFALSRCATKGAPYLNTYLHPWEIDVGQPRFSELPIATQIRHYGGTASLEGTVAAVMQRFPSVPLSEIILSLERLGALHPQHTSAAVPT